jgi:prophage tail gpP-like protein
MSDEVKLYVGGKEYGGWKDVSISRSLTAICGKFELSVTDSWDRAKSSWTLAPGKSCVVKIGADTVLTGFIDQTEANITGTDRKISVSGRDKTCDLVDCSMPATPSSYSHIDLAKFARTLCAPFGISVVQQTNVGVVIPFHRVNPGENIHSALEMWARRRGVLLTTDGLGRLIILKVGGALASVGLVQGKNLKKVSVNLDQSQRFKNYLIKTQVPAVDDVSIPDSWNISASAVDKAITRPRSLMIMAENGETTTQMKTRIQWEAAHRAAEGMIIEAEVVGWRMTEGGALWAPNLRVNMDAEAVGVQMELLVGEVTYMQSESEGTITKLKLARKNAYTPQPEIEPLTWGGEAAE